MIDTQPQTTARLICGRVEALSPEGVIVQMAPKVPGDWAIMQLIGKTDD